MPTELDSASGVGLFQQFVGRVGGESVAYDTSEPLSTASSEPYIAGVNRVRDQFRIAKLLTNDQAATTAAGATAATTDSLREIANNCKFVSMETSHSDNGLKCTVTFKFKPFNKAGTKRNYEFQSGDQTALAALSTYNTTNYPN